MTIQYYNNLIQNDLDGQGQTFSKRNFIKLCNDETQINGEHEEDLLQIALKLW